MKPKTLENDPRPKVAARRPDGSRDSVTEQRILSILADIRQEVAELRQENDSLSDEIEELKKTTGEYLDVRGVARLLNVSPRTVDVYSAAGELPPPLRIGGVKRWHREAIEAHLRSRTRRGRRSS